jgi:hypothetical protein
MRREGSSLQDEKRKRGERKKERKKKKETKRERKKASETNQKGELTTLRTPSVRIQDVDVDRLLADAPVYYFTSIL